MPILYSFKRCPYAMRARMALYLSQIVCEHREVSLKNKPSLMLDISPKGTVPVLILENGKVFEESLEIVDWCIDSNLKIFKDNITDSQKKKTDELISLFDKEFKFHLDRYKYATRYKGVDKILHRDKCIELLKIIEEEINDTSVWFYSNSVGKVDICILPFIRQFKIANPEWFDRQKDIPKVHNLLSHFIQSNLFKSIMVNYDAWEINQPTKLFPTLN